MSRTVDDNIEIETQIEMLENILFVFLSSYRPPLDARPSRYQSVTVPPLNLTVRPLTVYYITSYANLKVTLVFHQING